MKRGKLLRGLRCVAFALVFSMALLFAGRCTAKAGEPIMQEIYEIDELLNSIPAPSIPRAIK